jgi:hypothetical protein
MKRALKVTLLCVLATLAVDASAANATSSFSDAQAYQQLKKSGSDLSKLHRLEFQLRFMSEEEVAKATASLEALAFTTMTEQDPNSANVWVVLATKVMYPVETDIVALSDKLKVIAKEGFGTYEGWRARPKD